MEFAAFADRAMGIEKTDADLAVVAAVAELFADADADDLPTLARYVQGRPFPAWDDRKLDVGPSLCHEALARAAGPNVTAEDVETELADVGEIGAVAASLDLDGQQGLSAFTPGADGRGDALTVQDVRDAFDAIATASGSGSERAKADHLFGLFNRASSDEARYVARLVLGEMRIGVGDGTVRDAIATAFLADDPGYATADDAEGTVDTDEDEDEDGNEDEETVQLPEDPGQATLFDAIGDDADEVGDGVASDGEADEVGDGEAGEASEGVASDADVDHEFDGTADESESFERPPEAAVAAVERALQVSNDAGRVAAVARKHGSEGLADVSLEVGRPVSAMLAQAGTITDAVENWNAVAVETKYDGARVQIHHDPYADESWLFSRNMEDVTDALPEIVEFVEERVNVPVILDGEALAIDDDGSPLPFQRILERFRRKHDVAQARKDVAVELRAFDCLHHDGEDLLDTRLSERHARLERVLDEGLSHYFVTRDAEDIANFESAVLDAGHEGVMLKDPNSTYSAGKRGQEWLKRKPDVETLDVVVTGAEWGEGRRANVFGTFEVGVRHGDADSAGSDPDSAGSDPDSQGSDGDGYATVGKVATGITDAELESLTERLREHVATESGQTVLFEPAVVFEVGYEEIQASPTYDSGYALRFPRFVAVREDKAPADADSLERVQRLADD